MKIQALYDLQHEINRLFIAGSKFAVDDPRLLKHVPVLNKLGEKVPVFKKLAGDVEELTKASSQESSEKLLAISTLLYSILYTQGETVKEGLIVKEHQPVFDINEVNTDKSYLQLKPVIEALTTSNSGRLEVLKDAFKQNVFKDFRIYQHLNNALSDKYSELSDYVADKIIPAVGTPILPFIVKGFAYEDKTEHVKRIRILNAFDYKEMPEMSEKILAENLPNLQAEVIRYLVKDVKNEALISKLAEDKNKAVREAAYTALMGYGTKNSLEKMKNIYCSGKANKGVVDALSKYALPYFFEEILEQYNKALNKLLTCDKDGSDKELISAMNRVAAELYIFQYDDRPQLYDLIENILLNAGLTSLLKNKKTLLADSLRELCYSIIGVLNTFNQSKTLEFYNHIMPQIAGTEWESYFYTRYFYACNNAGYSKEKMQELFIKAYEKNYIHVNDLFYIVFNSQISYYIRYDELQPDTTRLHTEWMPHLYALAQKFTGGRHNRHDMRGVLYILDVYEPLNSKSFNAMLERIVTTQSADEIDFVFPMILRRDIPNKFELIYQSLDKTKQKSNYYYSNIAEESFWKQFPKNYAQKIRKIYERDKLEILDKIADAIEGNV